MKIKGWNYFIEASKNVFQQIKPNRSLETSDEKVKQHFGRWGGSYAEPKPHTAGQQNKNRINWVNEIERKRKT